VKVVSNRGLRKAAKAKVIEDYRSSRTNGKNKYRVGLSRKYSTLKKVLQLSLALSIASAIGLSAIFFLPKRSSITGPYRAKKLERLNLAITKTIAKSREQRGLRI
jgi:hypothetical protein